ncbi:unnamed protein product [Protopolystoma xenopodis]|uniref:Uncharacterized protein n=1 Tax=Protopolystoma xenopodis TaxID=117903 RepID=A0A448XAD9_9PLAT|nr:unnamed protein product [Protopolystoma xenopodis]
MHVNPELHELGIHVDRPNLASPLFQFQQSTRLDLEEGGSFCPNTSYSLPPIDFVGNPILSGKADSQLVVDVSIGLLTTTCSDSISPPVNSASVIDSQKKRTEDKCGEA